MRTLGRVIWLLLQLFIAISILILAWQNRETYSLIGPLSGIPGWLVFVQINVVCVLLGIESVRIFIAKDVINSMMRTGSLVGALGLLVNPYRFKGDRAQEFGHAFPIIYAVSTLVLITYLALIVAQRTPRAKHPIT